MHTYTHIYIYIYIHTYVYVKEQLSYRLFDIKNKTFPIANNAEWQKAETPDAIQTLS